MPTPLVVVAIYGRGDFQAFAIGALIPCVVLTDLKFPSFFAMTIWLLPMCGICGALAVATRRWIDRNRD